MRPAIFYWCISIVVMASGRELSKNEMEEIDFDLNLYLRSLKKISDFFMSRKYYVDVIIDFGAFLENLNLKRVLIDKGKCLPVAIRAVLEKLVRDNYEIMEYFDVMLERDPNPDDQSYRNMTRLLNDDVWLDRLENFHDLNRNNTELFLFYDQKYLKSRYSTWDQYVADISAKDLTPSVEESDTCLLSVALNPINYSDDEQECDVYEFCRQFMHRGTDRGYQLTHRLLFLLVANYGRGCYVISPEDDRRLRNKFCGDMYTESSYIEMNGYKNLDLFAEQILFCSLDGHSEFIKRHWLTELLSLQTKEGCFPEDKDNSEALEIAAKLRRLKNRTRGWLVNNIMRDNSGKFLMLGGRCNGHTTTLVAGVLSSAVRFLLEKFY